MSVQPNAPQLNASLQQNGLTGQTQQPSSPSSPSSAPVASETSGQASTAPSSNLGTVGNYFATGGSPVENPSAGAQSSGIASSLTASAPSISAPASAPIENSQAGAQLSSPAASALSTPAPSAAQQAGTAPTASSPQVASETPAMTASASPTPSASPSTPPAGSNVGGATLSNFGPGSDLIDTQITSAGLPDRYQMAQDQLKNFDAEQQLESVPLLRQIGQQGAAMGQVGSGMLGSKYGDLATTLGNQRNIAANSMLEQALQGTIDDQSNQRNELRGERTYENGLSQQGLQNGISQTELENFLTNSAFGRNLSTANYLNGYNPLAQMQGAQVYGNQASQLFGSAGSLMQQQGVQSGLASQDPSNSALMQYLTSQMGGGGSGVGDQIDQTPNYGGQSPVGVDPGTMPYLPPIDTSGVDPFTYAGG